MLYFVFCVANVMVLLKLFTKPPFFSKWLPFREKCQLCPISMKIDILGYIDVAKMKVPSKFCSKPPFFFQNGCHIVKISTLSDFNENWYLGVYWCGEHDGTIEICSEPPFYFKMAAILQKFQLCSISMKIDILGYIDVTIMMVLTFFFEIATILRKCHLCPI